MYFRVHYRSRVCFQGYATCSCEMGGVWDEVNTLGDLSIIWTTSLTRPALHYSHNPHKPDTPPLREWHTGKLRYDHKHVKDLVQVHTHTTLYITYIWEPVICVQIVQFQN